jgi:large subunit ribosomal protein L15
MYLNTIEPAIGSRKKARRLGRGIGSGRGKTCGKGHKGQHARAGGYHKLGFEGGQMPLQRRLPKFGFNSRLLPFNVELRLSALNKFKSGIVDKQSLLEEGFISVSVRNVKIILSGKIEKALTIGAGVLVTKGAKEAILAAGGEIKS